MLSVISVYMVGDPKIQISYLMFPKELRNMLQMYIYILHVLAAAVALTYVQNWSAKFVSLIILLRNSVCYR